jgi:acyl-CoA reductase-like NAD-dependent aldehyde dehydrogenase
VGRDIINPADGSVAAVVDEASADDASDAVAAARAAFDDGAWPATSVGERAALLDRIADLLQRDKEALSRLETQDTGKTLPESRIDIDDVTSVFRYYAKLVGVEADRLIDVGDPAVISRVVREPSALRAHCAMELPAAADVMEGSPRSAQAARWSPSPVRSRRFPRSPSSIFSRRPGCLPG